MYCLNEKESSFKIYRHVPTASSEVLVYDYKTRSRSNCKNRVLNKLKINAIDDRSNTFLLRILYNRMSIIKNVMSTAVVFRSVTIDSIELLGRFTLYMCKVDKNFLIYERVDNVPFISSYFKKSFDALKSKLFYKQVSAPIDCCDTETSLPIHIHIFKDSAMYVTIGDECFHVESNEYNVYTCVSAYMLKGLHKTTANFIVQKDASVKHNKQYHILMCIDNTICVMCLNKTSSWYYLLLPD